MKIVKINHTEYLITTRDQYLRRALEKNGESLTDIKTMWIGGEFVNLDSDVLQEEYSCYHFTEHNPWYWDVSDAYIWTSNYCYISCEYDGTHFLAPVPLRPDCVLEEYPMYGGG